MLGGGYVMGDFENCKMGDVVGCAQIFNCAVAKTISRLESVWQIGQYKR